MTQNKIIVKVGNKSTSRFRNAKVYRAITVKELRSLTEVQNPDIIIIESISEYEYSDIVSFLNEFSKQENKFVFFFVPDNNDTTTGAADELNLDIYLDIKDLYRAININCGINVDTDIYLNKDKSDYIEEDPFDSNFEDPFSDAIQASSEAYINEKFAQTKEVNFSNRAEAGLDESDEDIGIARETISIPEEKTENIPIEATSDTGDTGDADNAGIEVEPEEYSKLKQELAESLEKLKIYEEDNSKLTSQVKEAVDKVLYLNKVIKAVKDERDAFHSELKSLEEADII